MMSRKEIGAKATAQQRRASNPNKSVWVEASAGTGKTKVLSDRVLRILLKGLNPSKILCLTYTKAAAVEMNNRIAGRLSRWAVLSDEELYKELMSLLGEVPSEHKEYKKLEEMARRLFAVLLDTPGGVKIQTIHSFCQEVLKRFPLEAKISPYFEVMDERSSLDALEEVKTALLHEESEELLGALSYLTANVSEFKFPDIMRSIAFARNKIIRLFEQYNSLEAILVRLAQKLQINPNDNEESLIDEFFAHIDCKLLQEIREALSQGSPKKDGERALFLAEFLEKGCSKKEYENLKNVFLTSKGEIKLATKGAETFDAYVNAKITTMALQLEGLENKLISINLFASTSAVLTLASALIGGYNEYKRRHAKMDYEDLIVLTKNLLNSADVTKWVMYKLDGGIDALLIDEAQDTSPDQWEIVKNLTAEFFASKDNRTVFAVGDRKQSIYSFQGADPAGFEKMREYFAAQSNDFENVRLDVSFRSVSAVLDTVDKVFDGRTSSGVVLDNDKMKHTAFRVGDAGKIELWPLIEPIDGENPDVWLPPVESVVGCSTSSRLAKEIALKIKKSVEDGEILPSQGRPVRYKDFLVLVQRRNSFVEELVRECKNANVNIAGVDKILLLEQIAIQDLIALGKFLLLPTDDLTLASVLKSPLFGLNDDDLFKLCYLRRGTLWMSLLDNNFYANIVEVLKELLKMADFIRPFELYSHVLNKLGGRKKFVERMGLEVEDGLDEFVNLTLNFEQEHIPSLQKFVSWIEKDQVEIKRELEQTDVDAVRIMTVHGSKGLQAPIVILPDTVRVPMVKREGKLLWDDELAYFPLSSAYYDKYCDGIVEEERQLVLEEYRRLLYVALTRAEDRLCICGYRKKNKASEDSWYDLIKAQIGEGSVIETAQEVEPSRCNYVSSVGLDRPNFAWINQAAAEEAPLSRPFTPSKPEEEDVEPAVLSPIGSNGFESKYYRGKIIHKLLQILPDMLGDKKTAVDLFLDKNAFELSDAQRKRICEEVVSLIENPLMTELFAEGSKAEVAIMGEVGGRIISAQVDRLAVNEREVLVFDYKTNRPAAVKVEDVPKVYVKQMAAYKELLQKVYPDKKVRTFIVWTDVLDLMEIH